MFESSITTCRRGWVIGEPICICSLYRLWTWRITRLIALQPIGEFRTSYLTPVVEKLN